jgi:hypothetical protein
MNIQHATNRCRLTQRSRLSLRYLSPISRCQNRCIPLVEGAVVELGVQESSIPATFRLHGTDESRIVDKQRSVSFLAALAFLELTFTNKEGLGAEHSIRLSQYTWAGSCSPWRSRSSRSYPVLHCYRSRSQVKPILSNYRLCLTICLSCLTSHATDYK